MASHELALLAAPRIRLVLDVLELLEVDQRGACEARGGGAVHVVGWSEVVRLVRGRGDGLEMEEEAASRMNDYADWIHERGECICGRPIVRSKHGPWRHADRAGDLYYCYPEEAGFDEASRCTVEPDVILDRGDADA